MPNGMVERDHPDLSIGRQCALLQVPRSSFYHMPQGETDQNLAFAMDLEPVAATWLTAVDRRAVPRHAFPWRPSDDLAPAQLQGPGPQWGRVSPKTATR